MNKIRILIADDHALVRQTLAELLNRDPRYKVVGGTGSGEEAVALVRALRPDIVLMDIHLQGMDGLEATRHIRRGEPSARVVGLSLHSQWPIARQMLAMGAMGYVSKSSPWSELVEALEQVSAGYRYICRELLQQASGHGDGSAGGIGSLTRREREVLRLVKQGASSREIGRTLQISPKTVEAHRHHILKKLNLNSTTALVEFIHIHGL